MFRRNQNNLGREEKNERAIQLLKVLLNSLEF